MIALLLALILLMQPAPIIQEPVQEIAPIVKEVETPARFFEPEIVEDDWQSIFWSNRIEQPISAIKVALPEGETIKISLWDGEWPEGTETILYKGRSGIVEIIAEGMICDQIAVYSTGSVAEIRVSICYLTGGPDGRTET